MRILLVLLFCTVWSCFVFAQREQQYSPNSPDLPNWVKLLYSENPNANEIAEAYEQFYATNEFEKNQYTQYYKRWLRESALYIDENGFVNPPSVELQNQLDAKYKALLNSRPGGGAQWEEIGPWEYDHYATMSAGTQSPGAAHVYTVEQSASNPDVVYAGTANAGLWKSTDKGLSWNSATADLLIRGVYSIEIDHSDENTVYFEGAGKIWKTTNGGTSFIETGSGQDFDWVRDIRMSPANSQVVLAAANTGLYRTDDGGANWTTISTGHYLELEFHPTNSDIVYAVKTISGRTEFYKSVDGGLTFQIKYDGWPGVSSYTSSSNFSALRLEGSNSDHVNFSNVDLGSAGTPDFTIELRVKSSGWSGDPAIISNKNWATGLNEGFILAANGSGWKFNIGNGSERIDLDGGTINDGQWHHIAVSYDADGTKSVYQDGSLINSTTDNISDYSGTGLSLGVGQDGTLSYGSAFPGEVSDVRIWNSALTSQELNDHRCLTDLSGHPNLANLIHRWQFNEGSGSVVSDMIGSNNGTINGTTTWTSSNELNCVVSEMEAGEEQGRTEISVTADSPDMIYVLATGDVNGGSGLYGFYKSTDAGESFSFECCGTEPGGPASINNKNIVGYANDGSSNGGQYYYDLALGASPTDSAKVFAAGISVNRSEDAGSSWQTNGHWVSWVGPTERYTHADVHDVKFFENGGDVDMWVASDGGLYYSADQGDVIEPRMHGIHGTEFWGFDGSYKHDAMIGGTYHNGTLLHYNDLYFQGKNGHGGWFAGGAGDATKGHTHDAYGSVMFEGGGMLEVFDRLSYWNWLPFDNSKNSNVNGTPGRYGNFEWDPRCYNTFYSPRDSILWKTEDNGVTWTNVHDFVTGKIYSVQISNANPEVIYVVHDDESDDIVKIWRTGDGGDNWVDITPSHTEVGGLNYKNKIIEVDQTDENTLWFIVTGWSNDFGYKVFKTIDGGGSWQNLTGSVLEDRIVLDISHHQGSDGGVYAGTVNATYYRDNTMSDWVLYNDGLPARTNCLYLSPYFTEGKMRVGTYRSAFQVDLHTDAPPVAKISVDKLIAECVRDTFYFKDMSYVDHQDVSWQWEFPGATPSNSTEENPKVVYDSPGTYDVTLTVSNDFGTDSQTITSLVEVGNECGLDSIPGRSVSFSGLNSDYLRSSNNSAYNFNENQDWSISFWLKTTSTSNDAAIITDKDWDSGYNPGWVFALANGQILCNVGDGANRIDLGSGSAINDGEWHYVTGTFDRDEMARLYVDGVRSDSASMVSIGNIDHGSAALVMGADIEADYPFEGEIDEVKIWDSSLSEAEVRLKRHLTAQPTEDPNLIGYFQFNRPSGDVLDRVGVQHSSFHGGAQRIASNAPIGWGSSESQVIAAANVYAFPSTGIEIDMSNNSILPSGEVVASRINLHPDIEPDTVASLSSYWVINNYGSNQQFDEPVSITLETYNGIPVADLNSPTDFWLFNRSDKAHGNTWGASLDSGDGTGISPGIQFSQDNSLVQFGQFCVSHNGDVLTQLEGSEQSSEVFELRVYPNPNTTGILHVYTNSKEDLRFQLLDMKGAKVFESQVSGASTLNLPEVASGVYTYQVITPGFVQNGRLILE